MATRRKTLNQLLNEKFRLLDKSEVDFLKGIELTERAVYLRVLDIIKRLDQSGGRLVQSQANTSLLLRLKKEILKVIRKSTYVPKVQNFLTQFDKVENSNRSIYKRILGQPIKTNFSLEKKLVVDSVVDSLATQSAINANFTNPITKVITDSVKFGTTFAQAEENLSLLVQGTGKGGLLKRYAGQVVTDSINGFDGAVNDVIRDAFTLDGFRYVGSLIKDSRTNCKDWVKGKGAFKKFAIRPGEFRVEDIPAMIKIAKKRNGWNPQTTPQTFAMYRGGFRCRHQVVYFRLTDEQNQQVEGQLNQ